MVVALTGWVDAGGAGNGAMAALADQLQDRQEFGSIDVAIEACGRAGIALVKGSRARALTDFARCCRA